MSVQWTDEQLAIFEAASATSDNLLVEALAGAAKTTTLVGLASRLRGSTLSIAFNKKIATEMSERMPKGVECRTLNALGHRIWAQALGKRLTLSEDKCGHLLRDFIADCPQDERDHLYENLSDLRNIISGSKNHGHVPDSSVARWGKKIRPLMTDEEFFAMLPEEPSPAMREAALAVLRKSFDLGMEGTIDFADQLLLPTVTMCPFPLFANILVDEAQDLSELNHVMLRKLVKQRLIAVGDSRQAIYSFRGAHTEGMPLLATKFSMRTLHLSTTFRCPEAICEHVRWHVPRITAWAGNPNNPGEVRRLATWSLSDIPDGAAIICRNNAPLFSLAIAFLRSGRRPQVWGRDIAAAMVKTMETLGPPNTARADALAALRRWHEDRLRKTRRDSAKTALADRVDCMRIFIEDAETLGGAITFARDVLNSEGKVDLCTGHKSKGSEWNEVFILDRFLCSDDGQDLNLQYVMATRAKRRLTYLESQGRAED